MQKRLKKVEYKHPESIQEIINILKNDIGFLEGLDDTENETQKENILEILNEITYICIQKQYTDKVDYIISCGGYQ